MIEKVTEKVFPEDPREQLDMAINAVFKSWDNKRAVTYRKINKIPDDLGTAVNVQEMVFEIWEKIQEQELGLPEILLPEKRNITENIF